jgi:hypothetical protein
VGLGVEADRVAVTGGVGLREGALRERGGLVEQGARRLLVGLGERAGAEVLLHAQDLEEVELDVADVGAVVTHPDLAPHSLVGTRPGARAGSYRRVTAAYYRVVTVSRVARAALGQPVTAT